LIIYRNRYLNPDTAGGNRRLAKEDFFSFLQPLNFDAAFLLSNFLPLAAKPAMAFFTNPNDRRRNV
jgi:hypothetical protein